MHETSSGKIWFDRGLTGRRTREETRPVAADDAGATLEVVTIRVNASEHVLLEEAMRLTGLEEPAEVLRVALRELVERQRFLNWVASHERSERSGNA